MRKPNDYFGHKAAILILELRISVGSITAARRNYLGVRCVPFAEAQVAPTSVSFGEKGTSAMALCPTAALC
jgi:hypothetical protein